MGNTDLLMGENGMENYSILMTVYKKDNPNYVKQGIDSMLEQTVLTNDFVLVCDGPLTPELDKLIERYVAENGSIFNVIRMKKTLVLVLP